MYFNRQELLLKVITVIQRSLVLLTIIVHKILSPARDWSQCVMHVTEYSPLKTGECPSDFCAIFKTELN